MTTASGIRKPSGNSELKFENGRTVDIQAVMFEVNKDKIWRDTADFSKQFTKDTAGLRKLWQWVKYNIRYKEDPEGFQYIRYPSRLFKDGVGDCKSFTLFIVSVLQNMGIPYTIRFTRYATGPVTHVYPVAHLPDGDVIVDAVWTHFDSEKKYYGKAENFKFEKRMAAIYSLSGIGAAEATAASMLKIVENLPDVTGQNIADMTDEQYYKFLGFRAIGATTMAYAHRPAFVAPILNFTEGAVGKVNLKKAGQVVKKTAQKAGKVVVDAAKKVKEAWAKLINWVFKTALTKSAPFFLFTFLKKNVSPKIAAMKAKQNGILNWLCKTTGVDRQKVDATLRAAFVKQTGKQPEAMLNASAKSQVSGIGILPAVAAALPVILDMIKKIAAFFQGKKDAQAAPTADASAGSSTDILASEAQATGVTEVAPKNPKGKMVIKPSRTETTPKDAEGTPSEAQAPPSPSNSEPNTGSEGSNEDTEVSNKSTKKQPLPPPDTDTETKPSSGGDMSTTTKILGGVALAVLAYKVLA